MADSQSRPPGERLVDDTKLNENGTTIPRLMDPGAVPNVGGDSKARIGGRRG